MSSLIQQYFQLIFHDRALLELCFMSKCLMYQSHLTLHQNNVFRSEFISHSFIKISFLSMYAEAFARQAFPYSSCTVVFTVSPFRQVALVVQLAPFLHYPPFLPVFQEIVHAANFIATTFSFSMSTFATLTVLIHILSITISAIFFVSFRMLFVFVSLFLRSILLMFENFSCGSYNTTEGADYPMPSISLSIVCPNPATRPM